MNKYRVSFTVGGLFHGNSLTLAALWLELNDWSKVRQKVISENLLHLGTESSLKRVCGEIISRLSSMQENEIRFFMNANHQDQAYLLWMLICRRYNLVGDFAREVIRERFLSYDRGLSYDDFDAFFYNKRDWQPHLEKISSSTRKKIKYLMFSVLREVNILNSENLIQTSLPSEELKNLILANRPEEILFFPMFETSF